MGIDQVIEGIIHRFGDLEHDHIIDDYGEGKDTGLVDRAPAGNIGHYQLNDLIGITELYLKRKIRCIVLSDKNLKTSFGI